MPEYVEAMRLVLPDEAARADQERDPARWSLLPGLCCQAAGGDLGWAADIALAWFLLYMAAHVFDSVEDRDRPDWWGDGMSSGKATNIATGLLFSASAALNRLFQTYEHGPAAAEISTHFYKSILKMSGGQHLDLITGRPGLKTWFEIAEMKSGTFFALACWSGARLATGDVERLHGFSRFGSQLGVLLQIYDDLEDLRHLQNRDAKESLKGLTRSLPLAYALEVYPEETRSQLLADLEEASESEEAARVMLDLLDQCGAALYLKIEIERRQQAARAALDAARPDPLTRNTLLTYLEPFEIS